MNISLDVFYYHILVYNTNQSENKYFKMKTYFQ